MPILGCGVHGPAFDSVATLPDAGHHPPGVSVDPAGKLPPSTPRADTEIGVVVLRTPSDPEAIRALVRAFFRAVVEESPSELEPLLAPSALMIARSRPQPARNYYPARFARLDYGVLRGTPLYRENELVISEPSDEERGIKTPSDPRASVDERLVRIRIIAATAGRARLFADEVILRLVSRGGGWVIAEIVEDF